GPKIAGENDLRFHPGSGHFADTAVISRVNLHEMVNSAKASYTEWNFEKPKLDLTVDKEENSKTPSGMELEIYRYPHLYQLKKPGETYAEIQAKRQVVRNKWIECQSDASRFLPSYVFSIHDHPKKDINDKWWVVSVSHSGDQPGVLEHEAPDRGLSYQSSVVAIPEKTRFIPELLHPKNCIIGTQTAIVTGPEGEEIYSDKYGRVKVQFFWDREGKWDEKTTCWIRVSQGWAGTQYGTMAIPRIGHEVIVEFLEGDPDRPIITGRVYHELNRVPYELPANKTRTVFKSMSTPGKEGEKRGFNEMRIEDKKGEEEMYVHAEKDVNAYVKNDWKEYILNEKHETVDKLRSTQLKDEDHLIVHKDRHAEYKTKWLAKAGLEIHFESGEKIVFGADDELTLKVGGSFIKLAGGDVTIVGAQVKINSGGSPGTGSNIEPEEALLPGESPKPKSAETGAKPLSPGTARETDTPDKTSKACMLDAADNRQAFY
ncbi:MAG: type VI secretion system tip protein VgrG, partial [Treponema sp.]|nr:type VI secretion system tip protein VgrG [Treponema sp.]